MISPTISISGYYTCTLTQDGQAVCGLHNDDDQDVQKEALRGRYVAISTRGGHTCAIDIKGELACWGDDLDQQPPPGRYKAVNTGWDHACALTERGEAVCWWLTSGLPEWRTIDETETPAGRYVAISAGFLWHEWEEFSYVNRCALSEEGEAVCLSVFRWGDYEERAVDRYEGPYTAITSIEAVAGFCGVTRDGAAECHWEGYESEVVAFSETLPPAVAPPNGEATRYTAIAASQTHVCALTTEGQAVCGTDPDLDKSLNGHLWLMHPPDPAPDRYIAIDVSHDRACALTDGGEAVCWGVTANKVAPPDPPPGRYVAVSDGPYHTCALTEEGEAVCWGWNNHGQAHAPAGRYTAISAGADHTCALTEEREAVCWGELEHAGEAPPGPLAAISAGSYSTCALTAEGELTCSGDADFNRKAPSGRFTAISSGEEHACTIADGTGTLECWFPEWSWPDSYEGRFKAVEVSGFTGDHSWPYMCALTADGEAKCWEGPFGEVDSSLPTGRFTAIAVGAEHACALATDGEAVCWGLNNFGQAEAPPGRYTAISAASFRTCAVTVEGTVVCWGDTDYETNQSTP